MKITVWTLTIEYEDVLETMAFAREDEADKWLRDRFKADHDQWLEYHDDAPPFEQEELDALTESEFQSLLNDYSVTNEIESHELQI